MQLYREKNECRCCGSKSLIKYLDLGVQYLANSYHKEGEEIPKAPLEVMLCRNCFHSQLSVVVDPKIMFDNYLYVSGTTETLKNHFKEFAQDAIKRINGWDKNRLHVDVLDIASNDATLLEQFKNLGCNVLGIDPAKNLRTITEQKNIDVIVDYWSEKFAREFVIQNSHKKFDIVTACNVFAHVDDLKGFLFGCALVLKPEGQVFIELPYNRNVIFLNDFTQIYHEHLNYFLVNSFKKLATRVGFKIVDIIETKIHGGSIRFVLEFGDGIYDCNKVQEYIKLEESNDLLNEETYHKFEKRVTENCLDLANYILKQRLNNKLVVGYSASAKSSVLLQYAEIKLDYIVDDNKLKQGLLTPGLDIPIYDPMVLANEDDDLDIVILAWNFKEEIKQKIRKIRQGKKTNFIYYIPKFYIE